MTSRSFCDNTHSVWLSSYNDYKPSRPSPLSQTSNVGDDSAKDEKTEKGPSWSDAGSPPEPPIVETGPEPVDEETFRSSVVAKSFRRCCAGYRELLKEDEASDWKSKMSPRFEELPEVVARYLNPGIYRDRPSVTDAESQRITDARRQLMTQAGGLEKSFKSYKGLRDSPPPTVAVTEDEDLADFRECVTARLNKIDSALKTLSVIG